MISCIYKFKKILYFYETIFCQLDFLCFPVFCSCTLIGFHFAAYFLLSSVRFLNYEIQCKHTYNKQNLSKGKLFFECLFMMFRMPILRLNTTAYISMNFTPFSNHLSLHPHFTYINILSTNRMLIKLFLK